MKEYLFPGIITVRTDSSRLPKKCLLQFGKTSVIEHIIERCIHYAIEPIICTTTNNDDDILEEIAKKKNVRFFRGSALNKINRWSECVKQFNISNFHSIDADDLFFDGEEMRGSMDLLSSSNSDIIYPSVKSSSGSASVGFSFTSSAIYLLNNKFSNDCDTEYIWKFIEKVPSLKTKILPDDSRENIKIRLTLDYEEDFLLLNVIRTLLGPYSNRDEIIKLFSKNPDLYLINWKRNQDFLRKQGNKD